MDRKEIGLHIFLQFTGSVELPLPTGVVLETAPQYGQVSKQLPVVSEKSVAVSGYGTQLMNILDDNACISHIGLRLNLGASLAFNMTLPPKPRTHQVNKQVQMVSQPDGLGFVVLWEVSTGTTHLPHEIFQAFYDAVQETFLPKARLVISQARINKAASDIAHEGNTSDSGLMNRCGLIRAEASKLIVATLEDPFGSQYATKKSASAH